MNSWLFSREARNSHFHATPPPIVTGKQSSSRQQVFKDFGVARMKKKKQSQKSAKPNFDLIRRIARSIELEEVSLRHCEVARTEEVAKRQSVKIQLDVSGETTTLSSKDQAFIATIEFKLQAKGRKETEVFRMNSSFDLFYRMMSSDESFSKDELEQFTRVNGVFNAWPYFREFVQNLSARMGYPSITVPVFRIAT